MNVQKVALVQIKPYWRNPRLHDTTVKALKKSIERYGYVAPIIVDPDFTIIAGHARYKALTEMGFEQAHVVVADLPPEKVAEYRIADNKIAELADWDIDSLKIELRQFDVDALIGFSQQEIDRLLADSIGGYYDAESIASDTSTAHTFAPAPTYDGGYSTPEPGTHNSGNIVPFRPAGPIVGAVTDEGVERTEERLGTAFENRSQQTQDGYVNVRCPFCEETYTINKHEL